MVRVKPLSLLKELLAPELELRCPPRVGVLQRRTETLLGGFAVA